MIRQLILIIILLACCFQTLGDKPEKNGKNEKHEYRIMFYNLENLFDPFHDTLKNDYEFVSGGVMGWTWKKFNRKLQYISKVIVDAGGWRPPEIVAFSEVENRFVLIQLLKLTPLERFNYRIIHEESPDQRGIDVAMIYQRDKFTELNHKSIHITMSDSSIKTRDILYVKGLTPSNDTLHLFVNHWPSRTGGVSITMNRRKEAALTLRHIVDSISKAQPDAFIVIMGDFNDEPADESISKYLDAQIGLPDSPVFRLNNLMYPYMNKWDTGTNKFRGQWGILDQFIISSPLVFNKNSIHLSNQGAEIFAPPYLLQRDEKYTGTIPFRTYNGMRYQGGFSDHLPVLLHLEY
ncbi:MAG: endonuclease [Lentimicrobiaceae bacterium]